MGRPAPHAVTVTNVQQVSPLMVKVTFASESLATFAPPLPASHLKLFFETDDGTIARTYTPMRHDADAGEIDVEFVLHGDGVAATWASNVVVGQTLTLAGPGRGYSVPEDLDWFLLIVDQTALPAAATILRELPGTTKVTVIAEIDNDAEQRELPSDADVTWIWLPRNGRPAGGDASFLSALGTFVPPSGRGAACAGTEAATVRSIRPHLRATVDLGPDRIATRGYWKRGASNHPDGDYATD